MVDEITTSTSSSLSEAYSNMHKLDALLRDSDRRLKVRRPRCKLILATEEIELRIQFDRAVAAVSPGSGVGESA